MNNEDI